MAFYDKIIIEGYFYIKAKEIYNDRKRKNGK